MKRFRLVIPVMAILVLVALTPAGAVPLLTESEPNETAATADALPSGECFVAGSGATTPVGDDDFWSFQGTAGGSVWAYVDTGGTQNAGATSRDSRLTLLAGDGATAIEDDNNDGIGNGGDTPVESGEASAIAGAPLSATGPHFLRVTENLDDGVIDPYRLFLAVSTGAPAGEVEPNGTFGQATPLTACPEVRSGDINVASDEDWYSLSLTAGETIYISAGDTQGLPVSLRTGATGATVLQSGPIGNFPAPPGLGFSFNITAAGTYYVRVGSATGTSTGPYRLMVAHGPLVAAAPPGPPGPAPGGAMCGGRPADHVGTSGNDVLTGTSANETFAGLAGNDKIKGGGGKDTVCAGPDKDTVKGGGGKDTLRGGSGRDRLAGQGAGDVLRGQGGSDRLNGGPGRDRCSQGPGTGREVSCER